MTAVEPTLDRAGEAAASAPELVRKGAFDLDWGDAVSRGGVLAIGLVFLALSGMPEGLNDRLLINPVLSLGYLSLLWLPFVLGWLSGNETVLEGMAATKRGLRDVVRGDVIGFIGGLGLSLLVILINAFDLRDPLVNWSPQTLEVLQFNRGQGFGIIAWPLICAVLAAAGAGLHLLSSRVRRAVLAAIFTVLAFAIFETFVNDVVGGITDQIASVSDGEFAGRSWLILALAVIGIVASLVVAPSQLRNRLLLVIGSLVGLLVIWTIGSSISEDVFSSIYSKDDGLRWGWALVLGVLTAALALMPGADSRATTRQQMAAIDGPERTRYVSALIAVTAITLIVIPMITGKITQELLANIGIFLLLALGLNIVVGLAGILDLGYVAFFAVGGYTTAVLTSPNRGEDWPEWFPTMPWWGAFLVTLVIAALVGLFIGAPVIRMRGDYLAIVTLGFGEIIRILFLSDWLNGYFNGAQGITNVPPADFGFAQVKGTDPRSVFYLVLIFAAISIYVSWRVERSRLGRAWMAIREDESVAEAMGINTVNMKLMAFVVGAVLASFAGAVFAAKVGSIFPTSFLILVSIIILVVVIVGGMGNIVGVMVGAVVLIGVLGGPKQPGLLAEFSEYKLLIYGALLVVMMLQRPEGLVPNVRRSRELHQDEFLQDAWLKGEVDDARDDLDDLDELADGTEGVPA